MQFENLFVLLIKLLLIIILIFSWYHHLVGKNRCKKKVLNNFSICPSFMELYLPGTVDNYYVETKYNPVKMSTEKER